MYGINLEALNTDMGVLAETFSDEPHMTANKAKFLTQVKDTPSPEGPKI